ncbi:MAG: acyl-CoA desaturase [Spirochaetota bacterium]
MQNQQLYKPLSHKEIEDFGKEMEEIRLDILSKVGEEDAQYIRNLYNKTRYYEILGRFFIHFSLEPVTWFAGICFLSLSKIINNMELGHNVMHGQYDWMNDPELNSRSFDWDHVSDKEQWKFSHNYMHHTFTNIIDKDHDFGYNLLRLSEEQEWNPINVPQVLYNIVLAFIFDFGVGKHGQDIAYSELPAEKKTKNNRKKTRRQFNLKILSQTWKDYIFFPLLGGIMAPKIALANGISNVARNLWTHSIIFCGHFTENVQTFQQEESENESLGSFYLRQLKGSSNLDGGKRFHMLTGHLSQQIEHHMFPDIPANRYEEMAPRVQEVCKKYQQHYNTGDFWQQYVSVWKRIFAFSFPNSIAQRIMYA